MATQVRQEVSYILAALAAWRLTHLLAYEDGPLQLIARTRAWAERFSAGFACFYCLSIWVPLPFALALGTGAECVLLWLAGSGAVVLLHKISGGAPATYWEAGERNDELLRNDAAR